MLFKSLKWKKKASFDSTKRKISLLMHHLAHDIVSLYIKTWSSQADFNRALYSPEAKVLDALKLIMETAALWESFQRALFILSRWNESFLFDKGTKKICIKDVKELFPPGINSSSNEKFLRLEAFIKTEVLQSFEFYCTEETEFKFQGFGVEFVDKFICICCYRHFEADARDLMPNYR